MDFNLSMYIRPDAFILVPALYFLGLFLKQTPFIPAWTHSWILLIFSVVSCLLYYGFEIQSVVQGILVTGVTVISKGFLENKINDYQSKSQK